MEDEEEVLLSFEEDETRWRSSCPYQPSKSWDPSQFFCRWRRHQVGAPGMSLGRHQKTILNGGYLLRRRGSNFQLHLPPGSSLKTIKDFVLIFIADFSNALEIFS